MSEENAKITSVELSFQTSTITRTVFGTFRVSCHLTAEIPNEEVWPPIRARLLAHGLTLHGTGNFDTQITDALRREYEDTLRKLKEIERAYAALQEEARSMRSALSVLDSQLGFSKP